VAKANNTPYGLSAGVWTEKGSRILWMADQLRAGVVWANTFNQFDPTSPFGGYKESGYGREGGRHGLEAYVTTGDLGVSRVEVRKTYKLYIGGVSPAVSRAVLRGAAGQQGPKFLANAAQGSRKDARDAVVAARGRQAGWAGATAYNRGQVLYRVAEVMEGSQAPSSSRRSRREGLSPTRASRRRRGRHRPLGLVCRVVRQAHPGARRAQPGGRALLQHLGARADGRRRRPCPAGSSSCSGWSA
jgi:acyl-CoA reductase-like NAD-dependent aldehyde dehydrogenase